MIISRISSAIPAATQLLAQHITNKAFKRRQIFLFKMKPILTTLKQVFKKSEHLFLM